MVILREYHLNSDGYVLIPRALVYLTGLVLLLSVAAQIAAAGIVLN